MKKLTAIAALLCTLSLTVCDADAAKKAKEQAPLTEDQKTLYALGVLMSQSLTTFDLKPEELAQVQAGNRPEDIAAAEAALAQTQANLQSSKDRLSAAKTTAAVKSDTGAAKTVAKASGKKKKTHKPKADAKKAS